MADVTITYETLYELLRREKSREELQKLDSDFLQSVFRYLDDKNKILVAPQTGIFGAEEHRKTQNQLINVKTILTELYNRREKKIINAALDESRTGTMLLNKELLLAQEKVLYDELVNVLKGSRKEILLNTLALKASESAKPVEANDESPKDLKTEPISQNSKKLRFKQEVPKFMGTDLQVYGPFKPDQEAVLPSDVAKVIINKGKAEEIQ
jgi:DNA replication initiation complex subunit (GINS family)